MTASRQEINRWITTAKEDGAKYIISVCDNYDDYPIYCKSLRELQEAIPYYSTNMNRINEIIEIKGDKVIEDLTPSNFI